VFETLGKDFKAKRSSWPDDPPCVIPDTPIGASEGASETSEPGIHNHPSGVWIPGLRQEAHPGMTRIYLAGPDVFLPDAIDIGGARSRCARGTG